MLSEHITSLKIKVDAKTSVKQKKNKMPHLIEASNLGFSKQNESRKKEAADEKKKKKEPTKEAIKFKQEKTYKELSKKCKSTEEESTKKENDVVASFNAMGSIIQYSSTNVDNLHSIALNGQNDQLKTMMTRKDFYVDTPDHHGNTPLMYACDNGQFETTVLLLQSGANVNQRSKHGYTSLMFASWKGHSSIVSLLIKHGADVKASNLNKDTALHFAARSGHTMVCLMLRKAGADSKAKNKLRKTPMNNMNTFVEELNVSMELKEKREEVVFERSHKLFGVRQVASEFSKFMKANQPAT